MKNKYHLLLLTLCLLPLTTHAWSRKAQRVVEIIDRVNTYWQSNNSPEVRSFWDNAAYHTGNMEAEHNKWKGATEADPTKWLYRNYGEGQQHVLFGDWQICFQTYIDIYNVAMGKYVPGTQTSQLLKTTKDPAQMMFHHFGVIAAGHEADVLAVAFAGVDKTVGFGYFPHSALGQSSQRQQRTGQLFLVQHV